MPRLFPFGRNENKRNKRKKRMSPTARTPEGIRSQHPMYQYALNEYAQTVDPGTSNDDGKNSNTFDEDEEEMQQNIPRAPSGVASARSAMADPLSGSTTTLNSADSLSVNKAASTTGTKAPSSLTPGKIASRSPFEHDMPFATYEESYGEAYTGGHIKYIYPSGYTSMRPRSCPWKLSIVVFLLFSWLTVFIVGHCSDQADFDQYAADDNIDDMNYAIEVRWCGSRPLYLIWALSMLITGLSAAYTGVIGYIKCRDFVVANSRSQPPGVVEGKSDYYVRIEDGISLSPSDGSMVSYYRPSIYQSDGTPQFWGQHIYRPTQAAVAITSR